MREVLKRTASGDGETPPTANQFVASVKLNRVLTEKVD